ncbi:hypothetical protein [Paracoccus sp. Z118]|uniref:hypothetical protein n=1 Tax=Paracoccus sp. Z118 TaxID=2851017 RepID=UPI001C2BABFD|nr:hypothetical protein [Paracoccus sp. Z118]
MAAGAKTSSKRANGTEQPPIPLAHADLPPQHREQLLDLVRALARDAARADHAAGRDPC